MTYREELMNRMIRIYGFESSITIEFCKLVESLEENKWNDKVLTILVESHEADPQIF